MMNVDYIIIKNTNNPNILANSMENIYETTITDIKGETHKLKIIPHMFIPNFGISILKKLQQITTKNGNINIILTSEKHAQIIKGGTQYKNVHGITSKGIKICYSDKPHSLHNKRKLIINGIGSYNYVLYDKALLSRRTLLQESASLLSILKTLLSKYKYFYQLIYGD